MYNVNVYFQNIKHVLQQWLVMVGIALCAALTITNAQANDDVSAMLKQADQYRLDQTSAKIVSVVRLYQDGELDKTQKYHVYSRPDRESLVVFKSKVEAGQKMLMLADNYWLVMPKSRRPIRITPMQKLLGEASVGDISTLTWSEDYQGEFVANEKIENEKGESINAIKLHLVSITKGASYQKIDLWVTANSHFPVKADLYLRSGKMAKQAWFEQGTRGDKLAVTAMTLKDKIQPSKKTVIEYQSITQAELEDKYYNPSYLVRNNVSEL